MKIINKIFVIIVISIIYILFLSLLAGKFFTDQIVEFNRKSSKLNSETVEVEWEKLYPYNTWIKTEVVSSHNEVGKEPKYKLLTNRISEFGCLGNNWASRMFGYKEISKMGYIINYWLIDSSIGKNYVKLKNGYWVGSTNAELLLDSAKSSLADYYYLKCYLESQGIDFEYCYPPTKECALDSQLPDGVSSYANANIDIYIEALTNLGINYTDLRNNLHEDNLDHYSLFYKTDHHWNIDGAFWASSVIVDELNRKYNLGMKDTRQFGTFSRRTYKNAMFGSAGQAVTHFNANTEDFDILFPDFENEFSLEIPDKNIIVTGGFEDIFINYSGLDSVIEEGGGYAYEQILYGNRPYVKITNLNNSSGPRVLMIRDSFAIAVAPYLAFSCSELVLLDMRSSNGNFTGSVVECINQFSPDIVLVLQSNPQGLTLNKK